MKKSALTWTILALLAAIAGADVERVPEQQGNRQSLLPPGTTPLNAKGIASSLFGGGAGSGKVVNGVNLLTGQPSYSIGLGGVNVRGVSFPITLTYSGGTKSVVENDNVSTPTSWVGLGFNLSTPFVAINHKGTYASFDDVVFCNLGPYGGGQILLDSAGVNYQVASNPYIKVSFDTAASGEYAHQFTRWVFAFPDGKKMVFGQDANAQRYVMYNKGRIVASPYANVPSQKFIYRWDLSLIYDTIPNAPPKNKIIFEYEPFTDSAASNKSYIREAYVKNIKWMEGSLEVERYEFKTTPKDTSEYVGYKANEPRDGQKLFETRRLDTLKCFKEGALDYFYKFDWITQTKGLLDKIRVFHPAPKSDYLGAPISTGAPVQDSGWTFTYETSAKFYLLKSVMTPGGRKDSYTYGLQAFSGTEGDQDGTDYVMKRANDSAIPVTQDNARLGYWSVESTCDERFCYNVVRDGDNENIPGDTSSGGLNINQKMYLEVKRNLGSYFDPRVTDSALQAGETITLRLERGDPWSKAQDWQVMPMGDYVLVVNQAQGTVQVFENDGVKWVERQPFAGDSRYNGTAGFQDTIRVFPSMNYFVVERLVTNTPTELVVAVRKGTGWTSLNRTSSCDFNNKGSYGDAIRSNYNTCLDWYSNDLKIAVSPNFFVVGEAIANVINVFALNDTGGFRDISAKLQVSSNPSTLQKSGKPMNWEASLKNINATSDYFTVISQDSASPFGKTYLNGFFFDGDSLREAAHYSHSGLGSKMQAFLSQDYFVLSDPNPGPGSSCLIFWQKQSLANGTFGFPTPDTVQYIDANSFFMIRAHPSVFSLECYAYDIGFGLRPKSVTGNQYAVYLYQVNRLFTNGFADRSTNIVANNSKKLFNLSFSGSDNMLTGTYGLDHGSGGTCNENPNTGICDLAFYTARFHPNNLTTFVDTGSGDIKPIAFNGSWKTQQQYQRVISNASRLGTQIILDSVGTARRARYRLYQFDGTAFGTAQNQYVATTVVNDASLDGSDRNSVKTTFTYGPTGVIEFNSDLQEPQFETVDVIQKNSSDSTGKSRTTFNVDKQTQPLNGLTMFLNGEGKSSLILSRSLDTLAISSVVNAPYHNSSWAKPIYVVRPKAAYSQQWTPNKGRILDTTLYLNYCDTNGAPRFVLNLSRPEKILVSQSIFTSLGFPQQSATFKLDTLPDTASFKNYPGTVYRTTKAVASSKAVYSGYYPVEDSVWREKDTTLTDSDLRAGKAPSFSLTHGWLPGAKITIRDTANYFQVLESKVVKNKVADATGESYKAFFYEGLRSDPTAVVDNAKLANCAVLMAENGNAGLTSNHLDQRALWENHGVTFSSLRAHAGRYSLKVVDDYGPTINLYLKNVKELGYGFKVSAWIYSDTGTPVLALERRNVNDSVISIVTGAPVNGTVSAKRVWQRWEASLTYAQLTANNLFNGNNDHVRIWAGTGQTSGNSAKVIYIDDFVCVPTNATFQLTTYDKRGIATSMTGSDFRTVFSDLGFMGGVMATRDGKNHIFGAAAAHAMGEN